MTSDTAKPFRARPRNGEVLAIDPKALDFEFPPLSARNVDRTEDNIAVISICGPLEHHASPFWDSYEDILCRIECALGLDESEETSLGPACAIVLNIDSPGGEAAGSMYLHRKIRSLRKQTGVPIFAYANEMACSAAYAIASACDEIWLPDTGTVGSIGVIATLFDRTRQNDKDGLLVELVTSGEYKADNHADRELDDGIRTRMQARVDALAAVFFKLVAKARSTTPKAVASLEAGVFIGPDAVRIGVADGVERFDKFLRLVSRSIETGAVTSAA